MRSRTAAIAVLGWSLVTVSVRADVQTADTDNFSVVTTVSVKATPEVVWEHMLKIGSWWSSSHTWSGDSKNLTLDVVTKAGFEETLPDGGFVRHMDVIYSDPGKMLRMTGLLGPLQEHALQGTMSIRFSADGDKTTVKTSYNVSGHFPGGLDKVAPLVDRVLTEQFQRLANVAEGTLPGEPRK